MGYSPVFWGTGIAKLAQGRVPKRRPRSSMPVGASRIKMYGLGQTRWSNPSWCFGTRQPRHPPWGLPVPPALHWGSLCRHLSDWLRSGVRQGMDSSPGLEGAGGSGGRSGTRCQQQELLVFRGPWRDSDSQKPQAKPLNGNLSSVRHLGRWGSLRGWDELSYKQSTCQAATQ